ncbi:probable leucine-rich repeat receptor-like protein kinase IMK3 isoform X1 [Morus notabilis]|uniref:probable leucine-rich repeat receptor-like protein kinase IMK3 isoform X1 n=1 Tax=Morus notabilis TaxID=981085 RepID=UPI000CECF80F|nr:probable leucine-rich repeat receptor-like protein kinase IMK3 isoform X1 [Morus notabilis]
MVIDRFHKYPVNNFSLEMKIALDCWHFLYFLPFLLVILCVSEPMSSQDWDGVVVTAADFQSLQAFKHELFDPKGFLRSWNDSGYGACSGGWVGIKCAQGQVIVIQLPWKGLGGRITEKIGQLQALRKLSLHDNSIEGSIPYSLGLLPSLRGVQLFNNRLSGSIPPSLSFSPLLQNLDLSNNSLSGTIPPSLANCTKLFKLHLSFNSLSGSIPSGVIGSKSLIFLSLDHNNLSGHVPDSWGNNNSTTRNKNLDLSHNNLSQEIPDSFASLSRLSLFNVSYNSLSGHIPDSWGNNNSTTQNKNVSFHLQSLILDHNSLDGSIPASISNLSSLVVLNLEGNKFDSEIPEELGRLRNLSVLNLRGNHFRGPIPASIGNVSTLTQLDLSHNNLSLEIPDSFASLSRLSLFNVSYNNLSGSVPTPLAQKFNASSFVGNVQLCGYAGSTPCPSEEIPSAPSPVVSKPHPRRHKLSTKDIILIAAGALLIVMLIICCILLFFLVRRKPPSKAKDGQAVPRAEKGAPPAEAEAGGGEAGGKLVHFDGPVVFTADDLLCATAEIMGKSTYGTVYKATLEDGHQVAVKRLREKITKSQKEFETEVNVLGKIRHPNLLALRAYYMGPKGEKLLVFDHMPRGSLATFLHARGPETPINWPTRMKIVQGMTRGLFYLHSHENIIHGNLTSSNILLDEQANAKVADFGLSHLMTTAATSNVIATAGALGYRAPELSKLKKANTKTDVYSLGVIMLELLTGKSPGEAMNGMDLPQWVASIVKEEWTNEVFDLELMRDAPSIGDELLNTLKLALHCVDPSPSARPEVQQVLQQLEEIRPLDTMTVSSGDDGTGVPSTSE